MQNRKSRTSRQIPRSLEITQKRFSDESARLDWDVEGEVRCSRMRCIATNKKPITASKKWRTVKRRSDQEFTVDPPRRAHTSSFPTSGKTVNRFKITRHAQKLMFPETRT